MEQFYANQCVHHRALYKTTNYISVKIELHFFCHGSEKSLLWSVRAVVGLQGERERGTGGGRVDQRRGGEGKGLGLVLRALD